MPGAEDDQIGLTLLGDMGKARGDRERGDGRIHRLPPCQRAAVSDWGVGGVSDAVLPGVTAITGQAAR